MVKRLHADDRAVAMAEFIVVFVPVILVFLATIELARLGIAHLMVQRAAGMAVRACAVIKDQPLNCDVNGASGQNTAEQQRLIERAAMLALKPMDALGIRQVTCKTTPPSGTDVVDVDADFQCAVPLVRGIVCSPVPPTRGGNPTLDPAQAASVRPVHARAQYGHQGARYNCDYGNPQWLVSP